MELFEEIRREYEHGPAARRFGHRLNAWETIPYFTRYF